MTTMAGQASCQRCSSNEISIKSNTNCRACEGNTVPATNKSVCIACDFNETAASDGTCVAKSTCQRGQYSSDGYVPCTACESGKFSNQRGVKNCTKCEAGKVTTSFGQTFCETCLPTEMIRVSNGLNVQCKACPIDQIPSIADNKTSCVACSDGQAPLNGKCVDKIKCGQGQYSIDGYSPCQLCKAGSMSNSLRATSCTTLSLIHI